MDQDPGKKLNPKDNDQDVFQGGKHIPQFIGIGHITQYQLVLIRGASFEKIAEIAGEAHRSE